MPNAEIVVGIPAWSYDPSVVVHKNNNHAGMPNDHSGMPNDRAETPYYGAGMPNTISAFGTCTHITLGMQ